MLSLCTEFLYSESKIILVWLFLTIMIKSSWSVLTKKHVIIMLVSFMGGILDCMGLFLSILDKTIK
jgi:hypothetical protein